MGPKSPFVRCDLANISPGMVRPCPTCPFLRDMKYIGPAWIAQNIVWVSEDLRISVCHCTSGKRELACAGMMILLAHMGKPNAFMRIHRPKLDVTANVYESLEEFAETAIGAWGGPGAGKREPRRLKVSLEVLDG